MVNQNERVARLLVRALYNATEGEPHWRVVPRLHDLTEAVAVAVDRGWLLDRGDSVRLTDAGRDLARHGENASATNGGSAVL
jgi:hypothetical protein